jgi:hypothetical protein
VRRRIQGHSGGDIDDGIAVQPCHLAVVALASAWAAVGYSCDDEAGKIDSGQSHCSMVVSRWPNIRISKHYDAHRRIAVINSLRMDSWLRCGQTLEGPVTGVCCAQAADPRCVQVQNDDERHGPDND